MRVLTSLTVCALALLLVGSTPAEVASTVPVSSEPAGAAFLPAWSPQVDFGALNSCTVSLTCPYGGGTISCSSANNQCATSPDGDCVVCDGVTAACCDPCGDCLGQCDRRWERCYWRCNNNPSCELNCDLTWESCVAACPCP